jgi:tight adherence protein C
VTSAALGALLGASFGAGLCLVVVGFLAGRRSGLALRVFPYVRDLPGTAGVTAALAAAPPPSVRGLLRPVLLAAARAVERVLGGSASVERRLVRANLPMTVHDFRVSQVVWGLVGLAGAAVPASLFALRSPQRTVPVLLCALLVGVLGVLLRENRLTAHVVRRERRILTEFPTLASLLALAVAAGESPVAALDRVAGRANGELAVDLRAVLASVRTGVPLTRALDDLAARTGLPVVARFAEGMAVAVERGTPLADVLHAQAGDVREASRRALIETGARKEVLMMVPVVFLVLPVVVVFAFFPGLVGLRLVV